MHIDRTNYEIWLVDWLDGNLDETRAKELQLFLESNPDLKKEFEDLSGEDADISVMTDNEKSKDESFRKKESLKRKLSQLPESQFEHLCIASLEKDISGEQESELAELINKYPKRRKVFEEFSRTKLVPPEVKFSKKNKLYRSALLPVLRRNAMQWWSAAAIITIALILFATVPPLINGKKVVTAKNEVQYLHINAQEKITVAKATIKTLAPPPQRKQVIKPVPEDTVSEGITEKTLQVMTAEAGEGVKKDTSESINKVMTAMNFTASFADQLPDSLIALNPALNITAVDEDESRVGRFIARTFRGRILKEKTANETPLKFYEIAEAGVTGINKLLGWEMALDEKKDDRGRIKSVYFSSKVLKFNVPVKNSETEP